MIKAAIVGGSGYTGSELARILCRHPEISLEAVTSRQNAGTPVSKILPFLKGFTDLTFEAQLADGADYDVVFAATPHGASMAVIPSLMKSGTRVIDLSGDYRLRDPQTYEKWYGHPHTDLPGLGKAVYGMAELFKDDIANARLVANPGCYPTCSVLSLAPLMASGLAEGKVIVDAKSGTSGAGQEPSKRLHHPACGASVTPYSIGAHRHTPEIKMVLERVRGVPTEVVFTPHLLPIVRGMLTTSYVSVKEGTTAEDVDKAYSDFYSGRRFVRPSVAPAIPATTGSNFCEIGHQLVGENTVVAMGALDNLVKGGAGQAVQNANIMFKLDEAMGLDYPGLGV
ncbi:N-acetyl-gamma-glutamyl-phosphate reductase [Methanomassiliicoccus luminyensis]|uniref:N-acetyl-gamma-glutamyl-phosphate reductase n=1 Tax=Methanomassiliicoccus luminyensis TaxID=1080712 RepID=UPI0003664E0D|nr:N-acetyl-gamma-glutamyl-phosphate reductase [Methanomassiliicoccus luminyensis]